MAVSYTHHNVCKKKNPFRSLPSALFLEFRFHFVAKGK